MEQHPKDEKPSYSERRHKLARLIQDISTNGGNYDGAARVADLVMALEDRIARLEKMALGKAILG